MANTPKPVRKSMKADNSYTRAAVKSAGARKEYEANPSPKTADARVTASKKSVGAAKKMSAKVDAQGRASNKAMNKAVKKGNPAKIIKVSETAIKSARNTIKNRAAIDKAEGN
jgi:hypothetical protein